MSETSIEIITVFPHNQLRFKYRLNDGSFHTIKKEDIFPFLKSYVSPTQHRQVLDLLSRFRYFMILVPESRIFELFKSPDTATHSSLEDLTEKEIEKIYNSLERGSKNQQIPNDSLVNAIQNSTLSGTSGT